MQVHATYAKLKKFYGIIDSFNLDGYELLILILPGYPTIFNRIQKNYDDFVPLVAIAFSNAFTAS
jgi:hypothetical protein